MTNDQLSLSDVLETLQINLVCGYVHTVRTEILALDDRLHAALPAARANTRMCRLLAALDRWCAAEPVEDDLRALRFAYGFGHTADELRAIARGIKLAPTFAREALHDRREGSAPRDRATPDRLRTPEQPAYDTRRAFVRGELRDAR